MTRTRLVALALAAALAAAFALPAGTASAAKKAGPVVVGTDDAGDFNVQDDPTFAPIGDVLGADLVEASIVKADTKTLNFVIKLNALQTVPELIRYIWSVDVDGEYVELDGKFTNYSRGACDPTAGKCPPPRDPGQQPFFVRANCVTDATANLTTCEEVGIVKGVFDTSANTVTIPVPMDLIGAKPGSKIGPGTSDFTAQSGGTVLAIASAFVSRSDFPRDALMVTKTYVVPKK